MSKTVVPTPHKSVTIVEENQEVLAKIILSEISWNENAVMGNVSDKLTGKSIEGVCIKVCDAEYNPIAYNYSDIDGNFTIEGSFSPSIRILAGKKEYGTLLTEALPSSGIDRKALNLELTPMPKYGATIFGNVKDAQQKPLSGIRITIYKSNSLNPYDFTFTNKDGLFVFDNIEQGDYRISFQSLRFNERMLNIEVCREHNIITLETIFLKKKILKGTIYGIITDKNNDPVCNALVVLCNCNNVPVQITYTNEEGAYLFYRLDMGTYSIIAK